MFKESLREVLPPIVYKARDRLRARSARAHHAGEELFDGNDRLFKQLAVDANIYAEYGCGASTIWMANHTGCSIYGTDSSEVWLDKVRTSVVDPGRVTLHFADVGRVGDWGRPVGYDKAENFSDYTDWVWKQGITPDLVLVDGRFRVCCFLTSLKNAGEGVHIVFDDYTDRTHYHFVERFLKPIDTCGRQAVFLVPAKETVDTAELQRAIDQFRFVMD